MINQSTSPAGGASQKNDSKACLQSVIQTLNRDTMTFSQILQTQICSAASHFETSIEEVRTVLAILNLQMIVP